MIDKNKVYRTRSGLPVRIYATDGCNEIGLNTAVHGAILKDQGWVSYTWTQNGRIYEEINHPNDLIEIKEKIKVSFWVNVLQTNHLSFWNSKAEADNENKPRKACVQVDIECEDGEGLDLEN